MYLLESGVGPTGSREGREFGCGFQDHKNVWNLVEIYVWKSDFSSEKIRKYVDAINLCFCSFKKKSSKY